MPAEPTDDEIAYVAAIWQASCGVPIDRSLMILMSAVCLLIADTDRPEFWWKAVRQGVDRRLEDYQGQPAATHRGPARAQ